jgi:TRAP-type C4-dicarboxylate transport system permease small subunit
MHREKVSRGLLERLAYGLTFIENICVVIAGFALVVAILLTSANAFSRHLFAAPIEFQLELTQT